MTGVSGNASRQKHLVDVVGRSGLIIDGDWVESKDQDPQGDVRLVQLADVGEGVYVNKSSRFLTSEKARQLGCTFLKEGDILVARMPDPIGRACLFPGDPKPCVTVVDVCIVRPDPEIADTSWLCRTINSQQFRHGIERFIKGTTRQRISRTNLERVEISLPPLSDQRRMAAILDKADELRAKRRAAWEQLNSLTQAMFVEMFGEHATGGRKVPTVRLSSVCKRITDGTHQPPQWATAGIPFLFVSNIVDGQIDFHTQKFISDETHAELTKRCPIDVGDILYTTVGSYGNAALVTTSRKFSFQRHIAHIKPDPEQVDSAFLAEMLQSTQVRRQAGRVARGAAQKTVNLSELSDFLIVLPSLSEQRTFTRRLQKVDGVKRLHAESQIELGLLFTALQHRAFAGAL